MLAEGWLQEKEGELGSCVISVKRSKCASRVKRSRELDRVKRSSELSSVKRGSKVLRHIGVPKQWHEEQQAQQCQ